MATTLTQPNTKASTNPANNVAPLNLYNTVTGAKLNTGETYVNALGQTITQGTPVANQSTTTLSSANPTAKIPAIQNKTSQLSQTGITTTMDANGNPITTTANGAVYTPNPVIVDQNFANTHDMSNPAYANYKVSNATVTETGTTPTGGYYGDQYIPPNSKVPTDTAGTPVILQDVPASSTKIINGLNDLISKNDANTANLISSIKSQYESLIAQQKETNASAEAGTRAYSIMGGRGVVSSDNVVNQQVSYGIKQVADLTSKEMSAITQAQIAGDNQDYQLQDKINNEIETIRKEKQDVATKIKDNLIEAKKKLDEQALQVDKENTISSLYDNGFYDTASIMAQLKKAGNTTITSKEVGDTVALLSGLGGTGDIGEYNLYKAQTTQKGLVPLDFQEWKDKKDAAASKLKASEAYSTAYNTAAGKAAAEAKYSVPTDTTNLDTGSQSLLANNFLQTSGLSYPAFLVLSGQSSQLSRDAATRKAAMAEATAYAKKMGVDPTTFASRFKALNEVTGQNEQILANVNRLENDISSTLDNLEAASKNSNFGSVKYSNDLKQWVAKNLNDSDATQYAIHLNQLQNEYAAYNKAIQGNFGKEITDAEISQARNVIQSGIAKSGITGLRTAIENTTSKLTPVFENSLNRSRQKIWDLFGVGDKFQNVAPTVDPKTAVDNLLKTNPELGQKASAAYAIPGATDQDVLDLLKLATNK